VSDQDIFSMLDQHAGWTVAEQAVARAGGGGTFVLEIDPRQYADPVKRMRAIGWEVYTVTSQSDLPEFARAFSRAKYGQPPPGSQTSARSGQRGRQP